MNESATPADPNVTNLVTREAVRDELHERDQKNTDVDLIARTSALEEKVSTLENEQMARLARHTTYIWGLLVLVVLSLVIGSAALVRTFGSSSSNTAAPAVNEAAPAKDPLDERLNAPRKK